MVIKVCGIKTEENIKLMAQLKVNMVGLNFYPPSVRYVSSELSSGIFDQLDPSTKRVGVFVNETLETILKLAKSYKLDYIQLHGDEDVDFCKQVARDFRIIKVFRIGDHLDLEEIRKYSFSDYFLFDTATKNYGGSGLKFDWSSLSEYDGDTPFLLSGGIGPNDALAVSQLNHPQYAGIDINSKFESSPGIKDEATIVPFVRKIKII